jgi:hypothetical protein
MIISEKQQKANQQNAQSSTGPTTPEGIAAASQNAITYGLRTRRLLIPGENVADYWLLWHKLETEWQPETPTECLFLEQMCTSQWLLARMAASEQRIYANHMSIPNEFDLLDRVAKHRTRLERSFTTALHELQQLQKERRARQQPPVEAKKATHAAPPPPPQQPQPPSYVMSEAAEAHPIFCSADTPDTR